MPGDTGRRVPGALSGTSALLTGATAPTRYVGGTASGPPTSGTFAVGDFVIDQAGYVWICTVAGTPGTWVNNAGKSVLDSAVNTGQFITNSTSDVAVTGMVINPVVPVGRGIKLVLDFNAQVTVQMHGIFTIKEGSTVILGPFGVWFVTAFGVVDIHRELLIPAPAAGAHTYTLYAHASAANNLAVGDSGVTTDPITMYAELI